MKNYNKIYQKRYVNKESYYEARYGKGMNPYVVHIYWDEQGRRITSPVCEIVKNKNRDNKKDAEDIAKGLCKINKLTYLPLFQEIDLKGIKLSARPLTKKEIEYGQSLKTSI